jgi:hypothetical protein
MFAIYVWRAVREGGDTKARKSRRTLELPRLAAQALRQHHVRHAAQKLEAGEAWQDHNLVFCTSVGTPLDASNVRRSFRKITKGAGIGTDWSPRELRHSFVSVMSDQGVPIETIADLVGHQRHRSRVPAPAQAGVQQGCPHDEHHLRRQPTRVESPSEMAPIDSQPCKKGPGSAPKPLLTCMFVVGDTGIEPVTSSV